jgi:3D-(3,5/4)-trihydroxycyclohexane-1,2-dione acylhydrolase (decyclizing)
VRYSLAEEALADFAMRRGIPVAETIAGKASLSHDHPCAPGTVGVLGTSAANHLAGKADASWPSARNIPRFSQALSRSHQR